jgi:glycosyltransferase involved in cell wall biosynthesis
LLTLIIPAYNAEALLPACFESIAASQRLPDQIIVVDDSSTDHTESVASLHGATVLRTDLQSGPGIARNLGANAALGDLLFFLDADCLLHRDTLLKAEQAFLNDPELSALIGAYDLQPEATAFLSRFRNLMHSYYHHRGRRKASTFWGACGAIRREAFFAVGGFSPSFERPSIEDIELGLRLSDAGAKILLDPEVQIKHRKRWTFTSMLRTDVRDRAIPWTRLILARGKMENDLNTSLGQRLSVFLVLSSPIIVLFAWPLALINLILAALLNLGLYRFLAKHWSAGAAILSIPLHLFYFAYSGLTFGIVATAHKLRLLR